jgi:hypothetical protein
MNRYDLMIDLETWGIGPSAAIRAAAVCLFELDTGHIHDQCLIDCLAQIQQVHNAFALRTSA